MDVLFANSFEVFLIFASASIFAFEIFTLAVGLSIGLLKFTLEVMSIGRS